MCYYLAVYSCHGYMVTILNAAVYSCHGYNTKCRLTTLLHLVRKKLHIPALARKTRLRFKFHTTHMVIYLLAH